MENVVLDYTRFKRIKAHHLSKGRENVLNSVSGAWLSPADYSNMEKHVTARLSSSLYEFIREQKTKIVLGKQTSVF